MGRDVVREIAVARRVNTVQPGADHGHRAGRAAQGTFVRLAVDAQRQARHDDIPLCAERACEGARIVGALRRGVAAADDGDGGRSQPLRRALHVQQQRRVGGLQQARRVGRVAERQHTAVGAAAQPQPSGGQPPGVGVWLALQGLGGRAADQRAQRW